MLEIRISTVNYTLLPYLLSSALSVTLRLVHSHIRKILKANPTFPVKFTNRSLKVFEVPVPLYIPILVFNLNQFWFYYPFAIIQLPRLRLGKGSLELLTQFTRSRGSDFTSSSLCFQIGSLGWFKRKP